MAARTRVGNYLKAINDNVLRSSWGNIGAYGNRHPDNFNTELNCFKNIKLGVMKTKIKGKPKSTLSFAQILLINLIMECNVEMYFAQTIQMYRKRILSILRFHKTPFAIYAEYVRRGGKSSAMGAILKSEGENLSGKALSCFATSLNQAALVVNMVKDMIWAEDPEPDKDKVVLNATSVIFKKKGGSNTVLQANSADPVIFFKIFLFSFPLFFLSP